MLLPVSYLAGLYDNGIIRTIVDSIPDTAFKSLGTIQNDPTDVYDEGLLIRELNRLGAASIFNIADKWKRLLGGALIYIGATGSGVPSTPLDPKRIKNIEFLKPFGLTEIMTADSIFDENINSPTFGKILKYKVRVRAGNKYIEQYLHYTRCIPLYGVRYPDELNLTLEQRYWGISVINSQWRTIATYEHLMAAVDQLVDTASINIYTFADLDELLAAGNEKKMQTRIEAIQKTIDLIRAVIIGEGETFDQKQINFSGLADIIDRKMMQLSSVNQIPVSRLFGRSPSGLNATGGAEERIFNDMAYSEQNALTPEIQRLVDMLVVWKKLPEGDYSWKWGNIQTLTDEQKAEESRKDAEAERTLAAGNQLMIKEGVLLPEEVRAIYYKEKLEKAGFSVTPVDDEHIELIREQTDATRPISSDNDAPAQDDTSATESVTTPQV